MDYLNNWCGNLSVWCGKRYFNTDKYKGIEVKNGKQLLNSIETSVDNNAIDTQNINKRNSQIDNINDAVDNLLNAVKINSWQDIVNQIKQPNSTESDKEAGNEKLHYSLSQTEILSFCGKLLDILKTGDLPLSNAFDRLRYLTQYFEVKSKIAKIQNILLVREIFHREDNNNKDDKTAVYKNNEQKIQKPKEQLELVINANYIAFQSSIEEYKQLKKEIEDIDKNNNKINENNNQNKENIMKVNDAKAIMFKLQEIETQINKENFEQTESMFENENNKFLTGGTKQNLENQKNILTKKLELCVLKDCITKQIDNFTDIFLFIKSNDQNKLNNFENNFEKEKKNIANSINRIGLEYLSKMNNLIQANEYLNKDFDTEINNMNKQIENINNNIDNDNAKPYTTSTETSCMDSLCCRICAEEPITYTNKEINGRENVENILKNYQKNKTDSTLGDNKNTNNLYNKEKEEYNNVDNNNSRQNINFQGMSEMI
ncbi:MAG: hypothetical protein IJT15_03815 [Rickettsiales bacterium]|nr:hypothetical protein [Rickettsiales bacterium]